MKICFINNLYKPYNKGGAETVIENIMSGLVFRGHEVVLITLGRKDEVKIVNENIKIYYIKVFNIFSFLDIDNPVNPVKNTGHGVSNNILLKLIWWLINIFNIYSYIKIKRILEQEKPDIINLHNLTGIGFLTFGLARVVGARRQACKSILTLHDIQLAYPSGKLIYGQENNFINKNILRYFYEKLTKFLAGSPDVVISPSKWLLDFYNNKKFFKNSEKYILKNPVAFSIMSSRRKSGPREIRLDSGLRRNDKKVIKFLYVGQVEEYKGIFLLLNIFSKLKNYKLNIVGSGKDLEKAKKFANKNNLKNIIFYNKLNTEYLNKIYLNSDILIFPSLTYENCPTVILEAFSFGLPVIASRIGGVPELVENDKTGWLFEPCNEKELESIIQSVNQDRSKIDKTSRFCLEEIKKYNIDDYLDKFDLSLKTV